VHNRFHCRILFRLRGDNMADIIAEVVGWSVLTALVIAAHKGVFWLMTNNILEYFT